MSDTCAKLVLPDKGIRDIIGMSMYPISVRCDKKSAVNCTQMNDCNELKTFYDDVEVVQRKLAVRELTGKKVPISREH